MGQALYAIWEKHGDGFCAIRQRKNGWEVWLGLVPTQPYQNPDGKVFYVMERSFEGEARTDGGSLGRRKLYENEASEEVWEHYAGAKTINPEAGECTCGGDGWVNIAHPIRPGVIAWRLPCRCCNADGVYPDPWPPAVFTATVAKGG